MHPGFVSLLLLAAVEPVTPAPEPAPERAVPVTPAPVTAAPRPWSLDLTFHDFGLGLGDTAHVDGLRLNFRDRAPYVVHGASVTVWAPYPLAGQVRPARDAGSGDVTGLVVGLPLGAAGTLRGLGVGLLGLGAEDDLQGIAVGGLGAGAGGEVHGIVLGGLGAGVGEGATGAVLGLLGAGVGGDLNGVLLGGLGAGVGGDATGLVVGGLGAGAGGRLRGISFALLGLGAGEAIEGIAVAGLGLGAPSVRGVAAALAVGGRDLSGIFVAPAYLHVQPDGHLTGFAVSAWNRVLGEQRGLTIGILNYAATLHGVQLGLLNYAGNNRPGLRWLPVANVHL